jgi:DNA-binding SARP family transcriptional activator
MVGWETVEQPRKSPPAQLHVHLLGTPEVTWQGEPLDLPRRQVRALLYYLAVEARSVCRDRLCVLFWPDAGETTARHNLSRLLTLLHSALPDPAILAAHDDQLELRRACVWCDTRALDELAADWRARGALDMLRQAAGLNRGPFLDGFCLPDSAEFDLWVSQQRERWERLALQVLAALVDALALDGDYAAAIAYAQRALAIDELAEDVQRSSAPVRALRGCTGARAGRRSHAGDPGRLPRSLARRRRHDTSGRRTAAGHLQRAAGRDAVAGPHRRACGAG